MAVGDRLQRARLERGLSLFQVSEETKVQHWILDAIERGDLTRVPGGVFIRGYLTSFAGAVGLDGERIWTDHRAESDTATAEPAPIQRVTVPYVSRWTLVRVAAVVLVAAVVWANIPRRNSDTAPLPAPPTQERATDIELATATTGSAAVVPIVAVAPTPRDHRTEVSVDSKDVVASVAPEPETPAAESTDDVVITSEPEASTEPQQSEDPR
jgi:cytoskeletal protein RodZ